MATVTLRIIDGADRGHIHDHLPTPITIGREEGNTIQLNDDRISRFHIKIQDDQDKLILTDLESTNGTKVNGEDVQLRILRFGDVISLGRSVLVYGSRAEIAARLRKLRGIEPVEGDSSLDEEALDAELHWGKDPDAQQTLHTLLPPDLPEGLGPGQTAQLSEMLEYINMRVRALANSVKARGGQERVTLETRQWLNLIDLQELIAKYQKKISDPSSDNL